MHGKGHLEAVRDGVGKADGAEDDPAPPALGVVPLEEVRHLSPAQDPVLDVHRAVLALKHNGSSS